jgi:hypothetical protein
MTENFLDYYSSGEKAGAYVFRAQGLNKSIAVFSFFFFEFRQKIIVG